MRGAKTAAQGVHPDIGIAIDVTASGDQIRGSKMQVKLGGGAAIKVHDPGLVVPVAIKNWMIERCEADGIPYQLELLTGGSDRCLRHPADGLGCAQRLHLHSNALPAHDQRDGRYRRCARLR